MDAITNTTSAYSTAPSPQVEVAPEPVAANVVCSPRNKAILNTNFFRECQALTQRYLLKGYDGSPPSQRTIARLHHGAQHQSREALWAVILLQIRREAGDQDALDFPDTDIPALMKTCLLHDSGRKGEGEDRPEWEAASGENCRQHLLALGADPLLADECGKAIEFKDQPDSYPYNQSARGRLIRSLLHDADVLEVMRVRRDFDLDYLELYQSGSAGVRKQLFELAKDVRDIIAEQGDLRDSASIGNRDGNPEHSSETLTGHPLDRPTKWQYERAPDALMAQMRHLQNSKPAWFQKLEGCLGSLPEQKIFTLEGLTKEEKHLGSCVNTDEAGRYRNPTDSTRYYVKSSPDPANSENEVLMAQLARLFGLNVPDYQLHRENGNTYVVSPWLPDLQEIPDFSELTGEQKSQLFVVGALLGNYDLFTHGGNTLKTEKGDLVCLDWGVAGRYSAITTNGRHLLKSNFGNNPIELSAFKGHYPELSQKYFAERRATVADNHWRVFQDLTDQDLLPFVRKLLQVPGEAIDQLVELYGPEKPGERLHLRQLLHNRRAWFALRFPEACKPSLTPALTPAECGAVKASGVTGFCRAVRSGAVVDGEVRLWERQKADGTPQTMATLTLTPDAARQLESQWGILAQRRLMSDRLNFYRLHSDDMTLDPDFCMELLETAQRCRSLADELETKPKQWQDPSVEIVAAYKKAASLLEQAAVSNNPAGLAQLPVITAPVARLPDRVFPTGVVMDKASPCEIINGFGKLKPEDQSQASGQDHLFHGYLFEPEPGILCRYFAGDLPEAKTFERQLSLEIDGDIHCCGQQVFDALDQLGIDVERPSFLDLQEGYLDRLAQYSDCLLLMNKETQQQAPADQSQQERVRKKEAFLKQKLALSRVPEWDEHCNLAGGKKVYFYPPYPFTGQKVHNGEYLVSHRLNYRSSRHPAATLTSILNTGKLLCSYSDRKRQGVPGSGSEALGDNIKVGAGRTVFTRVSKKIDDLDSVQLLFKPHVMARLDAQFFPNNKHVIDTVLPFTDPVAARLRRTPPLDQATCENLAKKRKTPQDDNQLCIPENLSLDDLECISTSTDEEKMEIETCLSERFEHWPDGRNIHSLVVTAKYGRENYRQLCQHPEVGSLVKTIGFQQFRKLLDQNPGLEEGKITSLRGIHLSGIIEDRKFSNGVLDGAIFDDGVMFECCLFFGVDFTQIHIGKAHFEYCYFDRPLTRVNPEQLEKMSFEFNESQSREIVAIQSAFRHKFGDNARTLELLFNAGLLEHDAYFASGLSKYYLALSTEAVVEFQKLNKKLLQMTVEHHFLYPRLQREYPQAVELLTPYSLARICHTCENKPEELKDRIFSSLCLEIRSYWSFRRDKRFLSLPVIQQMVKLGKSLGGLKMLKESIERSDALKQTGVGIGDFSKELGENETF